MCFNIAPEAWRAGLSAAALVARDLSDARPSPSLVAFRRQVAQRLAAQWKNRSVSSDAVLAEHRRLAAGESSAPEKLLSALRRQRDLPPAASAVLDCCNIVAGSTLLGVRALARPEQPATVSLHADGSCIRGDGHPLDEVGSAREALLLLHGNRLLLAATLLKGAWLLAELLETFCGARVELVGFVEGGTAAPGGGAAAPEGGTAAPGGGTAAPEGGTAAPEGGVAAPEGGRAAPGGGTAAPEGGTAAGPGRPQISFETFQRLTLRATTALAAAAHAQARLAGLAVVTLRAPAETRALAPASILAASPQVVGASVIVATGLHPLAVDGERHTGYLLTVRGPSGAVALRVDAHTSIPDGERLY